MKVKINRDMQIGENQHKKGEIVEVTDVIGENLVRIGKAELVEESSEPLTAKKKG